MVTRRQLLSGAGTTSVLALLSGCRGLIEDAADSCPDDPAQSGGVTWIPDIGHPVFFGFEDHSVSTGAPRDMRIYYPTFEGTPQNAPVLRVCIGRWPVVLFLHGQTPAGGSNGPGHLKWQRFALVLARSAELRDDLEQGKYTLAEDALEDGVDWLSPERSIDAGNWFNSPTWARAHAVR
jgi:hypothetical protein